MQISIERECKVEYEQVEAMTVYNRVAAGESGGAVGKLSGVPFSIYSLGGLTVD
jgi:hypothetical protein